jgi:mono/diheme cytochrome c family protein
MKKSVLSSLIAGFASATVLAACATFNDWEVAGGGYVLYKDRCSGCHGLHGEGIPPAGPVLRGSKFLADSTVDDIKEVIRMGRMRATKEYPEFLTESDSFKNMPGFTERTLPDDRLEALAKWLKDGMPER